MRNLLTLLFGIPALWLSIYVFGWIVLGDIALLGLKVHREGNDARFWLTIVALALVCFALFGVAIGIFLGVIFPGRF